MDTLSTSFSTLKVPGFPPSTPRELHLFKPPYTSKLVPNSHLSNKPNSFSNKPTSSFNHKNSFSQLFSSSKTSSLQYPSPIFHQKASIGYAASLLDISQCNNILEAVEKDVRRFLKLLGNKDLQALFADPLMDDKMRGEVVKEVAEKGRFQKYLVMLVKLLVKKNKVGIVKEVLEEFERIYDELIGTRVVLVSSANKMEKDELFGIAQRVHKMSGAMKVKVRNLVNEGLPSFAV